MTKQKVKTPFLLLTAEGIVCALAYLLAARLPTQSSSADSAVFLIRLVLLASLALTVAALLVFAFFSFHKKESARFPLLFSHIAAGAGYASGLFALGGMLYAL